MTAGWNLRSSSRFERCLRAVLPLLATAGGCAAQSVDLSIATSTQAAMFIRHYVGVCTVEVSTSPNYVPVVHDLDGVEYSGANTDTGRPDTYMWSDGTRVVTLGHQTGDRALQQDTPHYWRVSGCGNTVTGVFTTALPGIGSTYPVALPVNRANWGHSGYPNIDWTKRTQTLIDPLTGIRLKPINVSGGFSWKFGPTTFIYSAASSLWTSTGNGIVNGSPADYSSTSGTDPIDVYADTVAPFDDPWGQSYLPRNIDDLGLVVYGSGSGAAPLDRQFTACVFLNPRDGCIGSPFAIVAPVGSVAKIASGSSDADGAWPNNFPAPELSGWGNALIGQQNYTTYGTVNVVNGAMTIAAPDHFSHFDPDLKPGARLYIAGSSPACANNLCTLASVSDVGHAAISENLTIAGAAYKCFGWGIRITKSNANGALNVGLGLKVAGSLVLKTQAEEVKCSPVAVISGDGITGHACYLFSSTNSIAYLYFIGNDGTMRGISGMNIPLDQISSWPPEDQPNGGYGQAPAPWGFHATLGNVFYFRIPSTTGRNAIFSATYTGDWTTELDYNYTMNQGTGMPALPSDRMVWANVMPASRGKDLASLVAAAYPPYNSSLYGSWDNASFAGISAGFALFALGDNLGAQDAGPGWVAAVDLTIPAVTMVVHTLDGSGLNNGNGNVVQWGTVHAAPALTFPPKWSAIATNFLRANNSSVMLGGPFRVTPTAIMRSGSWSSDTSLTWPPDSSYDNACPAGNPYEYLGATGNNCITIRVPGDPCNIAPSAVEKTKFPACNWNSNYTMPVPFAPGMLIVDPVSIYYPDDERLRVISVTQLSGGARQLLLQRDGAQDYCCVQSASRPTCGGNVVSTSHAQGWSMEMAPGSINTCGGTPGLIDLSTNSFYDLGRLFGGHYDIGQNGSNINFVTSGQVKFNIPKNSVAALPTYSLSFGSTSFSSVIATGILQGYPSNSQYAASPADAEWMVDTNAVNASSGAPNEILGNTVSNRTLTKISGNIYDIQVVGGAYNPKLTPLSGWAGRFILQDISGPNSNLATAADYSMCYAMNANECVVASTAGHTYVRVPEAIDTGTCVVALSWANTPCVMNGMPNAGAFRQQRVSRADPAGFGSRFLTYLGFGPGREYTYSKATVHPSGKWAIIEAPFWTEGVKMLGYLMEIPRWSVDSRRRNTFVEVPVKIHSGGGAYAEVQFGYSRHGSPSQFYCTPRAEACNTSSGPGVVFNFEGEMRMPASCAQGCTIRIPAISGSLMYYRVRHSADGVTWTNDDTEVTGVL